MLFTKFPWYYNDFIVDEEEVGLFSKRDFLTQTHVLTSTFALSNIDESETDLQKHLVKLLLFVKTSSETPTFEGKSLKNTK